MQRHKSSSDSPAGETNLLSFRRRAHPSSRQFTKLDVAGSIPVSRSRISNLQAYLFGQYSVYTIKRRPPSVSAFYIQVLKIDRMREVETLDREKSNFGIVFKVENERVLRHRRPQAAPRKQAHDGFPDASCMLHQPTPHRDKGCHCECHSANAESDDHDVP